MRFVSCLAIAMLVAVGVPSSARAQPLDTSNLAVRPILIEAPGFAVQLSGTYGPGGPSQGEVQISGAEYERYLDEVGDSPGGVPVPGSFSDVVLTFDLSSLSVAAAPIEGQVDIMVGPLADLVRTLGTERTAGYQVVQIAPGVFVTIFCDGPTVFGPCEIVPGEPFDPVTGELKMVGDDTLSHPDITDPRFAKYFASNTLRVLEVPTSVPSLGLWGRVALVALLVGLSRRTVRQLATSPSWADSGGRGSSSSANVGVAGSSPYNFHSRAFIGSTTCCGATCAR